MVTLYHVNLLKPWKAQETCLVSTCLLEPGLGILYPLPDPIAGFKLDETLTLTLQLEIKSLLEELKKISTGSLVWTTLIQHHIILKLGCAI